MTEAEINRFISRYGRGDGDIDFIHDSDRAIQLLWELITAKLGVVTFEYGIGCWLIKGGGRPGQPLYCAQGGSFGRAVANLFMAYAIATGQFKEEGE